MVFDCCYYSLQPNADSPQTFIFSHSAIFDVAPILLIERWQSLLRDLKRYQTRVSSTDDIGAIIQSQDI